jgi:hypothetical protein
LIVLHGDEASALKVMVAGPVNVALVDGSVSVTMGGTPNAPAREAQMAQSTARLASRQKRRDFPPLITNATELAIFTIIFSFRKNVVKGEPTSEIF